MAIVIPPPLTPCRARQLIRTPLETRSSKLIRWALEHVPGRSTSPFGQAKREYNDPQGIVRRRFERQLATDVSPCGIMYYNLYTVDSFDQLTRGLNKLQSDYPGRFAGMDEDPVKWLWNTGVSSNSGAWSFTENHRLRNSPVLTEFDSLKIRLTVISSGLICVSAFFNVSGRLTHDLRSYSRDISPFVTYRGSWHRRRFNPLMSKSSNSHRKLILSEKRKLQSDLKAKKLLERYLGPPIGEPYLWPAIDYFDVFRQPPTDQERMWWHQVGSQPWDWASDESVSIRFSDRNRRLLNRDSVNVFLFMTEKQRDQAKQSVHDLGRSHYISEYDLHDLAAALSPTLLHTICRDSAANDVKYGTKHSRILMPYFSGRRRYTSSVLRKFRVENAAAHYDHENLSQSLRSSLVSLKVNDQQDLADALVSNDLSVALQNCNTAQAFLSTIKQDLRAGISVALTVLTVILAVLTLVLSGLSLWGQEWFQAVVQSLL